jgi:hypothetical protein
MMLGEYRFENLPWWGGYTVCAEDEEAGTQALAPVPQAMATPSVAGRGRDQLV